MNLQWEEVGHLLNDIRRIADALEVIAEEVRNERL